MNEPTGYGPATTFIDPPSQEPSHGEGRPTGMQGQAVRMPFLQACHRVSAMLCTDFTPDDMVRMPANKRRCLEERIIDVAMNEGDATGVPRRQT